MHQAEVEKKGPNALSLHPLGYRGIIERALLEDLSRGGDLTTDAIVSAHQRSSAQVVARGPMRLAGLEVAAAVFHAVDHRLELEIELADGTDASMGDVVLKVQGPTRGILAGERAALNFAGQLSGVATATKQYVHAVEGTRARVVCTRKTVPGLRHLQKYAVRCGGGFNHRFGLDDAVLIKDNHLMVAGGVSAALARVRQVVGHMVKVELEVDTLAQLEEGLRAGVDAVLLDNMDPSLLREAVRMVDGRAITEASGGITLDTAAAIAQTGVDLLSVGALTHSAPCADLSLEIQSES